MATIAYASEKKDPDPVEEVQFYFKEDESSVVCLSNNVGLLSYV